MLQPMLQPQSKKLTLFTHRKTYQTLQLLINGKADPKDMDPDSMQLIREAYDELIEEMSSVEFDVESIKELVTPEALDSL